MWELYLFSFLGGALMANGIPHFVKGVTGQKHRTPFGRPSSALVNVCWGWLNFAVAAVLLHFAHVRAHEYRAAVVFAVGVLLMAIFLAIMWPKHPEYDKDK